MNRRVLGALGDLVEDVTVRLAEPIRRASDTPAVIDRRRGGSAANVAVAAAAIEGAAVFIGHVGDDELGRRLVDDLRRDRVETRGSTGGRTGTIVALLDPDGERSMLSDRGSSAALDGAQINWLEGLHTLHVPYYSLADDPLARSARTLIAWARAAGIRISIDASSTELIDRFGVSAMLDELRSLAPDVLLCNRDEAAALGVDRRAGDPGGLRIPGVGIVVVKRGADAATVSTPTSVDDVPAAQLASVPDSTGAGDAFAAGFLVAMHSGADAVTATKAGHAAAAARLSAQA